MTAERQHIETAAVHAGEPRPGPAGSVVFPIFQGTVYAVDPGTEYHDLKYTRLNSTPSQTYLHGRLAAIEGAEAALATSSGMAALTSVLRAGDHVLASDCLYGGTRDFLTQHATALGWTYTFVDKQRPQTWPAALTPRSSLFLAETIVNPLIRVARLPQIAGFCARHGLISVVDNTFASPVNAKPLHVGIDVVVHSATEYLNGHSDVVAGAIMGGEALVERIRRTLNHYGGCLDPHAGFLLARGLKTLAIRVKTQTTTRPRLPSSSSNTRRSRTSVTQASPRTPTTRRRPSCCPGTAACSASVWTVALPPTRCSMRSA